MKVSLLREPDRIVKLSELVLPKADLGFSQVAPLPCNVRAVEAALLFATGHAKFVMIYGPSGHGKTQILKAAESYIQSHKNQPVEVMSSDQFLKVHSRLNPNTLLIIDDCQLLLNRPKQRLAFRLALERRVRAGRPTFLAFGYQGQQRQLHGALPSPRIWMKEEILEPCEAQRLLLIQHLAKNEGMRLSPLLCQIIARKLLGNGRAIQGALHRLKLVQTEWLESSQILRACGVLDPFFADNPHWDLRHLIHRTAQESATLYTSVGYEELACYTMLRTANLCEDSVSHYLADKSNKCYSKAVRFAKLKRTDATIAALHHQFVDQVLARLLR
jgi:chromosomal replication initiation ATPase DnaA